MSEFSSLPIVGGLSARLWLVVIGGVSHTVCDGLWPGFSMERRNHHARRQFSYETVPGYCAAALAGLMVCGSIVKELWPMPDSYLSNKRNVLNVYFVKFSWGWTFCSLFLFIALTNYTLNKSISTSLRRLSTLLVGTVVWFTCTSIFTYIENATGSCYESSALLDVKAEYTDRRACASSGGYWHGFDISGHSFLLPYCMLMILEEIVIMYNIRLEGHRQKTIIYTLLCFLILLATIWAFMFVCTAVYFHDVLQKFLGFMCGVVGWYVTYRWWYLMPCSPGLPRAMAKQA
ncbi:acyl-coenzyme A diphosphatase FITM2 [Pseudophryne corroboree]|uniref:acyl-coenzyme A diphosphatase FITM2 n=1 Tax=Pseudophryne corroboree TaxID=495146 RepID=UPI003081E82D